MDQAQLKVHILRERKYYYYYYYYHLLLTIIAWVTNMADTPSWWGLGYADCIPCREVRYPSAKECPRYDKWHLMVRLHIRRSRNCGISLHCHYSLFHFDLEW